MEVSLLAARLSRAVPRRPQRLSLRTAPSSANHIVRCQLSSDESEASQPQAPGPAGSNDVNDSPPDLNQLQTRLNMAIAAEDYRLAGKVQQEINALLGGAAASLASWRGLGVPDWLAERVESLGYIVPTDIQRRAAPAMLSGCDVVIRSQTGSGKTLAFLLPLLSCLDYPPVRYPDDLKGPQAVIVVPQRELGVQIALLVYRLFGGSVNAGVPGAGGNMFTYTGPRGIKVRGCLDKDEVVRAKVAGYLNHVHVVVGTPECLAEVGEPPNAFPVMEHAKVVVVDEADLCLEAHSECLHRIMERASTSGAPDGPASKPLVALVGATMTADVSREGVRSGWLDAEHIDISGYATGVPPSLRHRFVVIPEGMAPSSVLAKLLRADVAAAGADSPAPRVVAFVNTAQEAEKLANPLRNALWEEHRVGLLLPDGEHQITILQEFRNNKTSMLLATPSSARGLDLPAVTHVYNLGVPETSTEYLHRAGRTGRTGMNGSGVVTTILSQDELPRLTKMARELNIGTAAVDLPALQEPAAGEANADSAKKALEDLYNLY